MKRYVRLIATVVATALFCVLVAGVAYNRTLQVRGSCQTREELQSTIYVNNVISQVPKEIGIVECFARPSAGLYELSFKMPAAEFFRWAESLGWDEDAILRNKRASIQTRYGRDANRQPQGDFEFDGYELVSRERSDGPDRRTIAYDRATEQVFLKIFLPLPKKFVNDVPQ